MTLSERARALAEAVIPATGLYPEEIQARRREPHIPAILAALENTRREAIEDAGAPIAGLLASLAFRMQCRVDSCLERHGSVEAATTSSGVGISYGLAHELARALQKAAETFDPRYALIDAPRQGGTEG